MMLRPTESKILWLQQMGRGLRKGDELKTLKVIDYIGNHRTFLLKPQTLFQLGPGHHEVLNALELLEKGKVDLPPGCEVTYELEAVEILKKLLRFTSGEHAIVQYYEEFRDLHEIRPMVAEAYHDGYNPRILRKSYGSWHRFVRSMGDTSKEQAATVDSFGRCLEDLEITPMAKSYKILVLLAMLNAGKFPGEIAIAELCSGFADIASRSGKLRNDVGADLSDHSALQRLIETNPIAAWTGGKGMGDISHFSYSNGIFRTSLDCPIETRAALQEMVREIAEWRLAEYLLRLNSQNQMGRFICKVSHSGGQPMLFLPDRKANPAIPDGWTEVEVDGELYQANFVKIALNVMLKTIDGPNELAKILHGWFGPDAGRPGTNRQVAFEFGDERLVMTPIESHAENIELWRSFLREEIPPLFGLEFSTAAWNVGVVSRPGHLFLLVTLEKKGKQESFQYRDKFLSPNRFQWQSQNQTGRSGKVGQMISNHRKMDISVHLFIRRAPKNSLGMGAPFIYCGNVDFVDWQGDQPATVQWSLRTPVPEPLWTKLDMPRG